MRTLFFGTPEIAVPFLERLCATQTVCGVITQPDRPAARGYQLHEPAVKQCARERGIPVFQPERFDESVAGALASLASDVGVVVSYGKLIPPPIFSIPPRGCFNVHFSLLPLYRGAAPMQWALINGERETGVTTFWIEKGLDTGPILVQKRIPIDAADDAVTLREKLVALGISAMDETLAGLAAGPLPGTPQQGSASFAPVLTREQGRIRWQLPAVAIVNLLRGTTPWPGVYTVLSGGKLQGKRLRVLKARPYAGSAGEPGTIAERIKNTGFTVRCADGAVLVEEVQPEGRKPMSAWSFLQGSDPGNGKVFE